MPINRTLKRINSNLERFETSLEKFGKHIAMLAKNSVKPEISALKRIEKDKAVIHLLKNDVIHRSRYSDIDVDGMHHLIAEIKHREKMLAQDERAFFMGNAFVRSIVGFEKDLLKDAGKAARELHDLSTGIQLEIHELIRFAEKDFKGDYQLDKAGLHRKSLMLANINTKLLQGMICLSSLKLDSSADLLHYHYEKSKVLNDAKEIIDLDEPELKDSMKEIASYYYSDLARTNISKIK